MRNKESNGSVTINGHIVYNCDHRAFAREDTLILIELTNRERFPLFRFLLTPV